MPGFARSASALAVALSLASVMSLASLASGCKRSGPPDGRELFSGACARCHGADGSGGLPSVPGGPAPRNFRDHAFHAEHTDAQIRATIVGGKGSGMPGFGRAFDDAQLDALIAYVRSFDPERTEKAP